MVVDRIQSKAARLRRIEHRLYNAPRGLRATELAEYCGVDRRTIYRDLQSLEEMGVPVWEDQGRYGIERDSYLSTIRLIDYDWSATEVYTLRSRQGDPLAHCGL